jgi:hypothetical protein
MGINVAKSLKAHRGLWCSLVLALAMNPGCRGNVCAVFIGVLIAHFGNTQHELCVEFAP